MSATAVFPRASEPSDDQLMARVGAGESGAFAPIVDRYKDRLVGYLARLTGDPDRAQDLAQEAFLRLFQASDRYRAEGHLGAYLFRIGTNLVRSEERRKSRWRVLEPMFANGGPDRAEPEAQRSVLGQELYDRLRREIARLPLDYRVPLVLFEIEEWSYREIAELVGCREGTVKSRMFRARQRLKEALTPYWTEGV